MDIQVREVEPRDKKDFVELSLSLTKFNQRQHDKFISDFDEVLNVRKQRVEQRFDRLEQSPHLKIFLALIDNQPVGYIRVFTYDEKFRYGCLDEMYVRQDVRGQGIGKSLLAAALRWMEEKRVVRMITSLYSWNAEAREFYEREGFFEYAVSYERPIPFE